MLWRLLPTIRNVRDCHMARRHYSQFNSRCCDSAINGPRVRLRCRCLPRGWLPRYCTKRQCLGQVSGHPIFWSPYKSLPADFSTCASWMNTYNSVRVRTLGGSLQHAYFCAGGSLPCAASRYSWYVNGNSPEFQVGSCITFGDNKGSMGSFAI